MAYERIKGKKPTVVGLEFGEKIAYMKAKGGQIKQVEVDMGTWNLCWSQEATQ